ncbi:MAG TPA: lamin tail domain-containing protein, partial [Roseiflexaceae bacterium]
MPLRTRHPVAVLALAIVFGLLVLQAPIARSSAPVVLINEFMPRPSSGAEWVELFNPSPFDVDVSCWKIDDDTIGGSQTTIPEGTIIPANGLLVVALTTNILNDSGSDAAQLLDGGGSMVDRHDYSSASAGQ